MIGVDDPKATPTWVPLRGRSRVAPRSLNAHSVGGQVISEGSRVVPVRRSGLLWATRTSHRLKSSDGGARIRKYTAPSWSDVDSRIAHSEAAVDAIEHLDGLHMRLEEMDEPFNRLCEDLDLKLAYHQRRGVGLRSSTC